MSYKIELHPLAVSDVAESYQWYEKRSEGLGNRFIASLSKRLKQIAQNPESYPL